MPLWARNVSGAFKKRVPRAVARKNITELPVTSYSPDVQTNCDLSSKTSSIMRFVSSVYVNCFEWDTSPGNTLIKNGIVLSEL